MSELNRLRWLCRRGMRELDLVLLEYLERRYPLADAAEREAFGRLLEMQDPDIHSLLLGRSLAEDREISDVIAILRQPRD